MAAVTMVFVAPAPASAAVGYNKLFQNQYSGKCLEISYGSTANMALAGQYSPVR